MDVPFDASQEKSFLDCLERISESVKSMSEDGREKSQPFFNRISPDDKTFAKFAVACWTNFYSAYYECDTTKQFPAECKYEVLIPTLQSRPNVVEYAIVSNGVKTGDRVVAFFNFFPWLGEGHQLVPKPWPVIAEGEQSQRIPYHLGLPPSDMGVYADFVSSNAARFGELQGEARVEYRVVTLLDEPCLRLPCYNIPYQCLHRMAFDDVELMTYDTSDIWNYLEKSQSSEISVGRIQPDEGVLMAMLFWPAFEIMKLSQTARMSWLMADLRKKKIEANQAGALAKRIKRYFDKHLSES